jgi:hypothetical protein
VNDLGTCEAHIMLHAKASAKGDWNRAVAEILCAIDVCPTKLLLPTLEALLKDARRQLDMQNRSWIKRILWPVAGER